ncbi:MAG: methyltransferase domain-containing protein [Bacteroidota bacterium]
MQAELTIPEYSRIADKKRLDFIAKVIGDNIGDKGRVLDVGCGNGIISLHLGHLGYDVQGIDVSEKAIEKAKAANKFDNVSFKTLSAEELAASGETYDVIICSEVLEHLDQPGSLLEKLHESLKEGGKLIVTVPNGNGPRELFVTRPMISIRDNHSWLWSAVNKFKRALGYSGKTTQSDADNLDHVQFFSKKDLLKLSHHNRFKIVQFKNSNFVDDVFPFSFFANRLRFLQRMDCRIADALPHQCTGGFMTVWVKEGLNGSNN